MKLALKTKFFHYTYSITHLQIISCSFRIYGRIKIIKVNEIYIRKDFSFANEQNTQEKQEMKL